MNGLPRQSLRSFLAMTKGVISQTKPYFYIQYSFFSQSLKSLRPSFLNKQERGKELAALVVPSLWDKPCIFVLLRALRNSLFFIFYKKQKTTQTSPHFSYGCAFLKKMHKAFGSKTTNDKQLSFA
jgi:hypothetical protein